MATILYGGRPIGVKDSDLEPLKQKILQTVERGQHEWLMVDPEDPTWLLIGPGIPVALDQADPPEMPEIVMPEIMGRPWGATPG